MKTLILFLCVLFFASCKSCSPTESENKLTLTALDASCTEVWLQVTGETGKEIQLTRDGKEVKRFTLTSSPLIIVDDSLKVKTSYNYSATQTDNGELSSTINTTTLDTTSHNFTWQTFTFGDPSAGSNILNDIVVISENDIWAVGAINITDTSVNGFTTYSAVHWDGNKWELKKLYYKDKDSYGNDFTMVLSNIRGVFAFTNTDIWLAAGSILKWNGVDSLVDFSFRTATPSGLQPGIKELWKY